MLFFVVKICLQDRLIQNQLDKKNSYIIVRINKNFFSYAQISRTVAHEIGHS